jgi:hypothetical protein
MRPPIFLIAPVFLAISYQSVDAQSKDNLTSWIDQERSLLAAFHMVPIIVPRGERVGDSYDSETSILIAGAGDCFPNLQLRSLLRRICGRFSSLWLIQPWFGFCICC